MKSFIIGALCACLPVFALADTPAPGAGAQTDRSPPPPSPSIWKAAPDGSYEHLQTGLRCPEAVGRYRRHGITTFDVFGLDVGCDYGAPSTAVTYYLTYHSGAADLPAVMAGAKRDFEKIAAARHPKFLSETKSDLGGVDWTVDRYDDDGGLRDAIWLSELSGWTFEYRLTYRAADEAALLAEVGAMTADIRATAGTRLAACAKAAPAQRNGTPVSNPAEIQQAAMMTSLMGGASESLAKEGKAKIEPTTTCLDQAMKASNYALVVSRRLREDGSDGLADEVAILGATPPASVIFAGGGLDALAAGEAGKPQHWSATLRRGDRTLIFGYFDGRPTLEQEGDLVARIIRGEAKAVGGFSVDGTNVNIMTGAK